MKILVNEYAYVALEDELATVAHVVENTEMGAGVEYPTTYRRAQVYHRDVSVQAIRPHGHYCRNNTLCIFQVRFCHCFH